MKHYLFCAGGCGARVLEAIVHLCAPGAGPEEIKVLMIDSDANGGNLHITNDIINSYNTCQSIFGGKLGEERFFRTKLSLFGDDGHGVAGAWSPVNAGQQFHQVLGYTALTPAERQVADLFFTSQEREMSMKVGFLGHPAIGAAALSLLPLYGGAAPWGPIAAQLTADLAQGPVSVAIAGSVFGGTGASVFFPLASWLQKVAGADLRRLRIGAIALAPYFAFPPVDGAAAAAGGANLPAPAGPDARKFPLATRAAAQFYDQMRQIGQIQSGAWPFTSMFWLGDDTPVSLPYCDGGAKQSNPPHFVELFGAQAALDFFAVDLSQDCCFYAASKGNDRNVVAWDDFPRVPGAAPTADQERGILKFLVSGLMHSDFYAPLFRGGPQTSPVRPETIPWYHKYFLRKKVNLSAPPHVGHLNAYSDFLTRHLSWWDGLNKTTPDRANLLNRNAFLGAAGEAIRLDSNRMKNLAYPDHPPSHGAGQMEFHEATCRVGYPAGSTDGAPAYVATLATASAGFVKKYYGV